jgi:hypothetical protein
MHLPLFLFVIYLANAAAAMRYTGIRYTRHTRAVRDYLDRLIPASKNAVLHELMGPAVGSDVNSYPQSPRMFID